MGLFVNAVHRPSLATLAVEFTEDSLMQQAYMEIEMWCNIQTESYFRPLTANSVFYDAQLAQYATLNSMPNIVASPFFNENPDYPNSLIIHFHQDVAAGGFQLTSRFRLSPDSQAEVEYFSF